VDADLDAPEEAAVSVWRGVYLTPDRINPVCRCECIPNGSWL